MSSPQETSQPRYWQSVFVWEGQDPYRRFMLLQGELYDSGLLLSTKYKLFLSFNKGRNCSEKPRMEEQAGKKNAEHRLENASLK